MQNSSTNSKTFSIENLIHNDDKTSKRKRLKVVSACQECRRKKTKCNGEKPCSGCIKSNTECKYVDTNLKSKSSISIQSHKVRPIVASPPTMTKFDPTPYSSLQPILEQQKMQHDQMNHINKNLNNSIQFIESRLSNIENVLQLLLQQQQQQSTINDNQSTTDFKKRTFEEDSGSKYHYEQSLKPSSPIEQHLKMPSPTPQHYHSDTSSVCSSISSPKISSIQSLLNDDEQQKNLSSFHKPTIEETQYYYF